MPAPRKRTLVTLDEHNLRAQFRWADPTVYRWSVATPGGARHPFVRVVAAMEQVITTVLMAAVSPFMALLVIGLICGLLGWLWNPLRFWGGVFFLVGGLGTYLVGRAGYTNLSLKRVFNHYVIFPAWMIASLMFLFLLADSPLAAQCSGIPDNWKAAAWLNPWLLFFAEHVRDLLTFGLAKEVWGPLTTIVPRGLWAVVATVTLRWLVGIAIVELLLEIREIFIRKSDFQATVKGMYVYCDNAKRFDPRSMMRRVGVLQASPLRQHFSARAFFQALAPRAANEDGVERMLKIQEKWGMAPDSDFDRKDPYPP